jgi:hypothetical protein
MKAFADTKCVSAGSVGGADLEAFVRDFSGSSLPGIEIAVSELDGSADTLTGHSSREGSARFRLHPGLWRMTASWPGFHSAAAQVVVLDGQRCVVNFYLGPEHVVETW